MIGFLVALTALAIAPAEAGKVESPTAVYETTFTPLPKSEGAFAAMGPVGPFYPQAAAKARQSGEAMLKCVSDASGGLSRCKIITETPAGFNFGAAASVLAQRKRISAAGSPPPGKVIRVRVPFVLGSPVTIAP